MREHARRTYDDDRLMFDYNPGDCLAYKYYRDALEETRNEEKRRQIVQKGLDRATSDRAGRPWSRSWWRRRTTRPRRIPVVELDDEEFDLPALHRGRLRTSPCRTSRGPRRPTGRAPLAS